LLWAVVSPSHIFVEPLLIPYTNKHE